MPTRRRFLKTAALATAAAAVTPAATQAAPRSRLIDPRWRATGKAAEPDHGAWDAILGAHLATGPDGIARFDYAAAPQAAVAAYLSTLQRVDPVALQSAAAFAYWINLYNALTVHTVLSAYPVSSIRKIGGSFLSPGPWRQKMVHVADQQLSLDDIEHGILRPIWRDARVHYAVNCAALGCPNLAARAYTAGRLGRMLDDGARAFVNHPRGVSLNDGELRVSSIYRWFAEDFGGTDEAVIAHLRAYASPDLETALASVRRIKGDDYDWRINDA